MTQHKSYRQLFWEDVREDDIVPEILLPVPYKKVILNVAATGDFFPGHCDPEYAREQGERTIYINTIFFQGFVDRVITDWSGPETFIARRKIFMKRSICAEDIMFGRGRVVRVYRDERGRHLVDLEIAVGNQEGICCPAEATIVLPRRGG